ncbi:MAG: TonB-dependent receptor [Rhizomicrobium sp.]
MRTILLASAGAVALLATCMSAQAQTSSADGTKEADQRAGGPVETVLVTAERRSENLQTTALSATVLTGPDLSNKGIITVDQLQFAAPAVVINNFGQGIDFNIRGIGKAEHNSQTTTGVITYRDGVATFPGYFTEEPYYDLASVEILRGPQGTFVGSNATGGAVFANTNNPIIGGDYSGYGQGQVGNYTDFALQGAVNVPISDTLAARVAFYGEARDSFYSFKGPGGTEYTGNPGRARWGAGRVSLLWQPTESLTVLFKTDADYLDNGAYAADPVLATNDPFKLTANAPQLAIDRFTRSSLKIDYVFPGGITLRSVSGYQNGNTSYTADLDGTSTGIYTFTDSVDETTWSQEINLISPDTGMVTWVLGAYAQSDSLNFLPPYRFVINTPFPGPGVYALQGTNPKTSFAGFGQVSVNLPAGFQVQVGGRYSFASTKNNVDVFQYGTPIVDQQRATFSNISYKAALSWKANDNNFFYGFVATGFRPGGLNVPVGFGLPAPFKSEKVTEYELGYKTTAFDGHLRAQIDGYYNHYENFQVTIGYPTLPIFGFELNNPNPTEMYGIEAETQAVFGAFSFDAGLGWMHSSLGEFFATDPRVATFTPCDPVTGPASISCFNLKGHEQTYAPNFTFNLGAQYVFNLDGGDTLTPRVNFGHIASQWATLFENPARGDRLTERNILGGQIAWTHGGYIFSLYGTNLTDQHYVGALNSGLRFVGPPRQYGVRIFKVF